MTCDFQEEGQLSLRGNTDEIAGQLKTEIQSRLHKAGVKVLEARITHLAYAPEIASAMRQRQQAGRLPPRATGPGADKTPSGGSPRPAPRPEG